MDPSGFWSFVGWSEYRNELVQAQSMPTEELLPEGSEYFEREQEILLRCMRIISKAMDTPQGITALQKAFPVSVTEALQLYRLAGAWAEDNFRLSRDAERAILSSQLEQAARRARECGNTNGEMKALQLRAQLAGLTQAEDEGAFSAIKDVAKAVTLALGE